MKGNAFWEELTKAIADHRPVRIRTKTGDTYDPAYISEIDNISGTILLRHDSTGSGSTSCFASLVISQIESVWILDSSELPDVDYAMLERASAHVKRRKKP